MKTLTKITYSIALSIIMTHSAHAVDYYLKPFSDTSIWNVTLDHALSKYKNVSYVPANKFGVMQINSSSWSVPIYLATATDKHRNIHVTSTGKTSSVRVPKNAVQAAGLDAISTVYDSTTDTIHEFYKFDLEKNTAKSHRIVDAKGIGIATKKGQYYGIRASGASVVGGMIRDWEIESNEPIEHSLALAISAKYLKAGPVWPAASQDRNWATSYSGWIPMGSLITIKPEVNLESLLTNKLALRIATALQQYGAYVLDRGGSDNIIMFAESTTPYTAELAAAKADLQKVVPNLVLVQKTLAGFPPKSPILAQPKVSVRPTTP